MVDWPPPRPNKKLKKKKKKIWPLGVTNSPPMAFGGGYGHPHGLFGVAEATPKGPWGWRWEEARGGMLTFFCSLRGILTQLIVFEFREGTN
jgi:hypothetical protein